MNAGKQQTLKLRGARSNINRPRRAPASIGQLSKITGSNSRSTIDRMKNYREDSEIYWLSPNHNRAAN
jgi:hypothetical protein